MVIYADIVMLLNFLVDGLLLLAANRLTGSRCDWKRSALAAGVGALYAGLCVVPDMIFLGNFLWRLLILGIMSIIAYGWNRMTLRSGAVFVLLSMSLGGLAMGAGKMDFWGLAASAAGLWLLCRVGFRGDVAQRELVNVELTLEGKKQQLIALVDTGNTLQDPVSGRQVLVVGADIGWETFRLSAQELKDPVSTLQNRNDSRLRLIPYRSVGHPSGMLIGAQFDSVKLRGKESKQLVAFAPESFGKNEAYQALAGGII